MIFEKVRVFQIIFRIFEKVSVFWIFWGILKKLVYFGFFGVFSTEKKTLIKLYN